VNSLGFLRGCGLAGHLATTPLRNHRGVMVDTAIVLGAGASKAEGAPLQGDLFRDYFASDFFVNSHDSMDRELADFFR